MKHYGRQLYYSPWRRRYLRALGWVGCQNWTHNGTWRDA